MAVSRSSPSHHADMTNSSRSVGDVFLKNAYYSTNVNKNQISLAKLV